MINVERVVACAVLLTGVVALAEETQVYSNKDLGFSMQYPASGAKDKIRGETIVVAFTGSKFNINIQVIIFVVHGAVGVGVHEDPKVHQAPELRFRQHEDPLYQHDRRGLDDVGAGQAGMPDEIVAGQQCLLAAGELIEVGGQQIVVKGTRLVVVVVVGIGDGEIVAIMTDEEHAGVPLGKQARDGGLSRRCASGDTDDDLLTRRPHRLT